MKELFKAIYDKFEADATLKAALWKSDYFPGFYSTAAPQSAKYPYVVFTLLSGDPDYFFIDEPSQEIELQFSIFSDEPDSPSVVSTIFDSLTSCFDDATLSVTGYTTVYCLRSTYTLHRDEEDNTWRYDVSYLIRLSKD